MGPSIIDVAKLAQVSPTTVSHVINKTRRVAEPTKRKVLHAIKELGYKPNLMARNFKLGKKQIIGFIVPDIMNSFFSTLIQEIESILYLKKYQLIVATTRESKQREKSYIRSLSSGIVDGLIVTSTLEDYKDIRDLISPSFPMVFLDRRIDNCPHDAIATDNYDAIYSATESLIGQGHRRIGIICGLDRLNTTKERQKAYMDALIAHGIPIEKKLIAGFSTYCDTSVIQCMDELLRNRCSALIVAFNIGSVESLYYLKKQNVKINDDLEIIEYKDPFWSNYRMEEIGLLDQPIVEMGRIAAERILARINGDASPPKNIIKKATFTPRKT